MDTVALDFSERVLATRKCCECLCDCATALFVSRKWNQSEEEMSYFIFYIGDIDGKWKYSFATTENLKHRELTLDALMQHPNLKNVRIYIIVINSTGPNHNWWKYDVIDVKKLLNFVSVVSNKPRLDFGKHQLSGSYEGRAILNWLDESWFSRIEMSMLTPDHHRIVENQMSQPKMTQIVVNEFEDSAEFLENLLMSGDLRRVDISRHIFPSRVLERIIQNVLDDPEEYCMNKLKINASFDNSSMKLMEEMAENGRCRVEKVVNSGRQYTFEKQTPNFLVVTNNSDWYLFYDVDKERMSWLPALCIYETPFFYVLG